MRPGLPRLHVVTNDAIAQLPDLRGRVTRIGAGPAVALHARAPSADAGPLAELAETLGAGGGTVFVNDRADVSLAVAARGVHLPATGLPVEAVRRLVGPDVWLGRSAHDPAEARAAMDEGADYVFLGPIWRTTSHPDATPLGLHAIGLAQPARVIAIGGVTPERVAELIAAGAYGAAVISAVWDAPDPGTVVRTMMIPLGG